LKAEILIAKRILKDSNLCELVCRKFNDTIDVKNENIMVIEGAIVT
jgi:hypothetical protein